jgi:hypothetical protein
MPGSEDAALCSHDVCVPHTVEATHQPTNVPRYSALTALAKISDLSAVMVVFDVPKIEQEIDYKR